MVDRRRTDRLDGYTISSPCEPNGSGELENARRSRQFYWRCQLNLILTGLHENGVTFKWEKPGPMRYVLISAAVDRGMRQSEDAYL